EVVVGVIPPQRERAAGKDGSDRRRLACFEGLHAEGGVAVPNHDVPQVVRSVWGGKSVSTVSRPGGPPDCEWRTGVPCAAPSRERVGRNTAVSAEVAKRATQSPPRTSTSGPSALDSSFSARSASTRVRGRRVRGVTTPLSSLNGTICLI